MFVLTGDEHSAAWSFVNAAIIEAKKASCLRSKCGSVIVKDNLIIGRGYNNLPGDKCPQSCLKDTLKHQPLFKSDKTCCIHAEQRAIMNALKGGHNLTSARLYFIRLDEHDTPKNAGSPYCTMCSKLALDSGIAEFVLWHKEGLTVYDTEEYNDLSFRHGMPV